MTIVFPLYHEVKNELEKVRNIFNKLEYLATGNNLSDTSTNILYFGESGIQINNKPDTIQQKMNLK
jgi:hypothetical protein